MSSHLDFDDHPIGFDEALDRGLFRAFGVRAVDGDTVDVVVDPGFRNRNQVRLRLRGVDTPEVYGVPKESDEYRAGHEAMVFVEGLVVGKPLLIDSGRDTGKYGRWIADVWVWADGEWLDLVPMIVMTGHGEPIDG